LRAHKTLCHELVHANPVSFAPDGSSLVMVSEEGQLAFFQTDTCKQSFVQRLEGVKHLWPFVVFNHSGDLLVTAEPIIDPRAFGTSRIHILDWRGKKERVPSGPISLWGVIAGISKYSDEDLKLRFAASDAEDFFKALTLAGDNLFGA